MTTMFSGVKLAKGSREIRAADDEAWPLFLQTAERAGFVPVAVSALRYRSTRLAEAMTWAPTSKALHFIDRHGISPDTVVHHAMHFLCDAHCGTSVGPNPMSMLYFENIACNMDVYFAARIVQNLGVETARARMSETFPFTLFGRMSRAFGRRPEALWTCLAEEEPFALFKKVVREVDELQRLVREVVNHWRRDEKPSRRLPLHTLRDQIHALPHLVFSSYFDHLLHLTFARFHKGRRTTKRDLVAKRRCEEVLARSSTLAEFMRGLGATAPEESG
jgi:hypothetical protein